METGHLSNIELKDIPNIFTIKKLNDRYILSTGSAKPISINLPFQLDMEMARLCGMIPDGCLYKTLSSCSFSQKKDKNKVKEFGKIIESRFGKKPKFYSVQNVPCVNVSSKTLCSFLYHVIGMHKSDESTKIPHWIQNSPDIIVREYLRYAFAMEGSVGDPRKGKQEIRFHSVDRSYLEEISSILRSRFYINSDIFEYFIKNYGYKYYLAIYGQKNIRNFLEIGFALKSHQKRLEKLVELHKPRAWEITLVTIIKMKKNRFRAIDLEAKFNYLCKRAVHWRLKSLCDMGYLKFSNGVYSITRNGVEKGNNIKDGITIVKLRTVPKDNEDRILAYMQNKISCCSDISRALGIQEVTVRDVVKRLENKNLVRLSDIDKFQRKKWEGVHSGGQI